MIVDERMTAYINSLNMGNNDILNEIEEQAHRDYVPVIRKETQQLLKTMLAAKRPRKILEVGTAVGFSALLMHTYNPVPCHITTIENYEKRIPIARENFRKAGCEDSITLMEGDAQQILKELQGPFDFVFMDAAKGQYIYFLPDIQRLLSPGGFLISDNVLQEGDVLESRYAVTRRNRTIHTRMREYLYALTHSPGFVTSLLPVGDGVTVSIRTEQSGEASMNFPSA